jgi:hypothetical protein
MACMLGPLLDVQVSMLGELPRGLGGVGQEAGLLTEESPVPRQGFLVVAHRDPGEEVHLHDPTLALSRRATSRQSSDTHASHTRDVFAATLPDMATTSRAKTVATPWGAAHPVEQLTLQQRAGDRRFASLVQLLETDKGERLVRFAYTTDGSTRRGPVTLKLRDLERLRAALAAHPALAEALLGGGGDS